MQLDDLHVRGHDDGTYTAVWGPFLLKSGYQPIFRMNDGPARIGAFEALCRPFRSGAPSSPGKFFPLVPKDEGFLVELQTRAVHVLNASSVLHGNEWLFLNFDPSMFNSRASVETALDILDETLTMAGVGRERIVCEVTEHRTEEQQLMTLVGQMRQRGFKIAVDDYGADDSDMARVRKLSPDIIKFDAFWITRLMDSGTAGAELLKEMVRTFREQGILTLFEGIEHGWQLDLAVDCHVEFVQGFVLARPQTVPVSFSEFRPKNAKLAETIHPATSMSQPTPTSSLDAWEREISALMDEAPSLVEERPQQVPVERAEPRRLEAAPAAPMRRTAVFGRRGL